MSVKKRALQIALFLLIMFLTFYALFSGRDLAEIARAVANMSKWYLVPAVGLAVFFVCAEGYMIWYLLRSMRAKKDGEKPSSLPLYSVFFHRIFLFRNHTVRVRRPAGTALLHEQGRQPGLRQHSSSHDCGSSVQVHSCCDGIRNTTVLDGTASQ